MLLVDSNVVTSGPSVTQSKAVMRTLQSPQQRYTQTHTQTRTLRGRPTERRRARGGRDDRCESCHLFLTAIIPFPPPRCLSCSHSSFSLLSHTPGLRPAGLTQYTMQQKSMKARKRLSSANEGMK